MCVSFCFCFLSFTSSHEVQLRSSAIPDFGLWLAPNPNAYAAAYLSGNWKRLRTVCSQTRRLNIPIWRHISPSATIGAERSAQTPVPSSCARHCCCRQLRSSLGCAIVYNASVATAASCAFLDVEKSAGFISFLPIAFTSIILSLARRFERRRCMVCTAHVCASEIGRARVN